MSSVDPSVGALLWVRRRNGSWWPGRVIGPDELPKASVSKPRSGTPIKLLGREDASVDWYNLEKSKRVKAFRCGDYDDCITQAKKSASVASKKRVSYARREDAILHALELEKLSNTQNEEQNHVHEEKRQDLDENFSNSEDESNELSQSIFSFEEIKEEELLRRLRMTLNGFEEDGIGVKRMRGLKDLGSGVNSSLLKRKRSQFVNECLKRKDRRRTLSKVLENCSVFVSVPVVCEFESNESKIDNSTVINNNNNNYSDSSLVSMHAGEDASIGCKTKENEISSLKGILGNGFSEKLVDVPLFAEEKLEKPSAGVNFASLGLPTNVSSASHKIPSQSSLNSHIKTINESVSTSSASANVHNICCITEKSTSEWKSKGKRSSRSRKTDTNDETVYYNRIGEPLISEVNASYLKPRHMPEIQLGWKSSHTRRSTSNTVRMHDVKVEVKTDYRPQHVPYISMMGKLCGRAIIAHPIAIEPLDDGYCDDLLLDCYSSSSEAEYVTRIGGDGLLSKKIKKLSTLTNQETQKQVDGVSGTCVSLNSVFGRINGALHI